MSSENSYIGGSLGNYCITAEIGSGGFGKVYRGQHTILTERKVAIKQLHSHLGSPQERDQFLEEARLLERLKHPHILYIFDAGIHEGFPYLVAEYAPGGSLRDHLNKYAPNSLPIEEALTILSQIGQALHYAHQQNVIHRDLKPANILFNTKGEALLADFGIATTLSTTSVTHAAIIGTPPYMAPEQFQGSVSKESDQYSLGCIAYELFTGRVPFTAKEFFAMGFDHMTKQPLAPTQINPDLPIHIERAILKALAKQRGDRHANVKEFIVALHTPADEQSLMSTVPAIHPVSSPTAPTAMLDYSHAPTINHEQVFNTPQPIMEQKTQVNTPHSPDREAHVTLGTRPLHNQEPVTPIPPVNSSFPNTLDGHRVSSTPYQEPITPPPPTSPAFQEAHALSSKEPVTPIPLSEELITGVTKAILLSNSMAASTTQTEKKRNARRKWALIVIASMLIVAINIGTFYYVFSRGSLQNSVNNTSTQQPQTATSQGAIVTSTSVPTNASTPIASLTRTTMPNTVATNAPGSTSTPAPSVTPMPSPTPTPGPIETLTVDFINGMTGVSTTHTYHGSVSITVSGTGQEAKNKWNDAFYQYTDSYGNPITPYHTSTYPGWTLWINGGVADNYVNPPSYNSYHSYSFTIHLQQAGYLTFAIGDTYTKDNTGYLSVTVTQQN